MARSFPLLALLVAAPLVAQVPESVDAKALPNYHRVRADVATAGLPSPEAVAQLKAMGFKTVIDLRTEQEGTKAEQEAAEKAGLRYVSVPMTAATFSAADVAKVASVVDDEAAGPVLLHCAKANRAGAMWAALLAAKGKPLAEAEAEGRAAGLASEAMAEAFRRVSASPKP
jgi:uncharacterized protein (TIGR01244 family)